MIPKAFSLTGFRFCRFTHLNPDVILSRLVLRKHYGVAIQVAKHLKLPESWILEHWAYHKVMSDPSKLSILNLYFI